MNSALRAQSIRCAIRGVSGRPSTPLRVLVCDGDVDSGGRGSKGDRSRRAGRCRVHTRARRSVTVLLHPSMLGSWKIARSLSFGNRTVQYARRALVHTEPKLHFKTDVLSDLEQRGFISQVSR